MNKLHRNVIIVTLSLIMIVSLHSSASSSDSAKSGDCQTFHETGKTLCGAFLSYWQQHGGLSIFGYPISQPFQERSTLDNKTYTVQYLERAVFEAHPENKPPYAVLLAQLGTYRFQGKYAAKDPSEPYTDNLPRYQNAQDVQITKPNDPTQPDVIMTYTVKATPQEVLLFYKDVYQKNGWFIFVEKNNFINFAYRLGDIDGSVPVIDIEVTSNNLGVTKVTVSYIANG